MEIFDYKNEEKESVPCNLCSGSDFAVLSRRSKNNLSARTVMCKDCSLVFISPRMTKDGYDRYYKYHYRSHRALIKGNEPTLDQNFASALKFGRAWGKKYRQYLTGGLTIDVGSSTGGLLAGLKEEISALTALGIEPSLLESEYANEKGIHTKSLLFEDFEDEVDEKAVNIFCVQSLNHLLDPSKFLKWAYDTLLPGGHIHLAVKNFRHQARRAGFIEASIQIDHVYMFLPETLKKMVEAAGFEVVSLDVDEKKSHEKIARQKKDGFNIHHIRLVGKKRPDFSGPVTMRDRKLYLWTRLSLSPFMLKSYYLFWYSRFLLPVRKLLQLEGIRH